MEDGDIRFTFTAPNEKTTAARYGLVSADMITDNYLLVTAETDKITDYCIVNVLNEPESRLCGSTQVKHFVFHFEAFLLYNTDDIVEEL